MGGGGGRGGEEKQTGMGKSGHVVMLHKWILKTKKIKKFKKYKLRLIAGNLIFRCGGRRRDRQGGGGERVGTLKET